MRGQDKTALFGAEIGFVKGMEGGIAGKTVNYDFERLMEGAKLLKWSEFGDAIIENM